MESTSQFLNEKTRAVQAELGPEVAELKKNLTELNGRLLSTIKERPGACLLGALALGFVVGRLVSR